jgi:hypothetical protein
MKISFIAQGSCVPICLDRTSFGHHIPNISNKKKEATMEIIIHKGCGLDVHKGVGRFADISLVF